jgi:hypothetical protein
MYRLPLPIPFAFKDRFFAILNHMAYRSWLKDVKHVGDLGQQLGPVDYRGPNNDKREDLKDERWLAAIRQEIPVATEFKRYFGTSMHDSWVIGVHRNADQIRIELDSIEGNVFCTQYGLWLDVEFPEPLMPVELHCHDVCYARWARHDKRGWLKHAEPRFRLIDPSRTESDSFGFDFFHEQGGRIQWTAIFRAWKGWNGGLDSDLYLMADCASLTAVDRRSQALDQHFGSPVASMWDEYFNQSAFSVWDQPELFDQFELVSVRKGWTKNDLRQELLQVPGASILEVYRANVEAENLVK